MNQSNSGIQTNRNEHQSYQNTRPVLPDIILHEELPFLRLKQFVAEIMRATTLLYKP